MNAPFKPPARIRVSTKGQIVIPKDIRERFNWDANTELQVTETGGGIFLQPVSPERPRISHEEFRKRLPKYTGPYIPESEWREIMEADLQKRWAEKGC
jgi:AbrB family looped-hinge helix DNA binding protein